MRNNISIIRNCFGCGVCVISCPKHIIQMRFNADGFYEPFVTDENKCVNCSLCLKNCSFYNTKDDFEHSCVDGIASWSNDPEVRAASSSGGTGFEIARYLVGLGYTFCGVRYNAEKGRAEHYLTDTVDGLKPSEGSKYIQSLTVEAFKKIDFKNGRYVVVGTPCQIASLHRIIERKKAQDRFVLVDFFCHGVPSMFLWRKYCSYVESGIGKISYASWRNKQTGWHDSWAMSISGSEESAKVDCHDSYNMLIREKKGFYNSRMSQGDLFYKYFLGHYCLGNQCTSACRFKMTNSYADIRIGDLWGDAYKDEDKGVTGVLALTTKGKNILEHITTIHKEQQSVETVCEGQMKTNAHPHPLRPLILRLLKSHRSLSIIDKIVTVIEFPLKALRKAHLIKY